MCVGGGGEGGGRVAAGGWGGGGGRRMCGGGRGAGSFHDRGVVGRVVTSLDYRRLLSLLIPLMHVCT